MNTSQAASQTAPRLSKEALETARAMFLEVMDETGELDEALTVAILAALNAATPKA